MVRLKSDCDGSGCAEGNVLRAAFGVAVLLFVLGWCSYVAADCTGTESDSLPMQHESIDGWWVERALFDCITRELEIRRSVDALRDDVRLLDGRRIDAFKAHLELEKRATERASAALTMAREDLEGADSWAKSPVLWFAAGVLVSSVAVVAVGAAVQ